MQDLGFVIVTSGGLPEAYFLAVCLAFRAQRFAVVDIARPATSRLRALSRLRRTRGAWYVIDLALARLLDALLVPLYRRIARPDAGAFPEVDAEVVHQIRTRYPHLDCSDADAPEVPDFVRSFAPDYILLAGCPILKPTIYGLARRCALNRHLGALPGLRGSDCPLWAFALGRPEWAGYSIHVVNERVDAGDVVLRRQVIAGEPSFQQYLRRLRREASDGFVEIIDRLLQGAPLPRGPQSGGGRYCPPAGPGHACARAPRLPSPAAHGTAPANARTRVRPCARRPRGCGASPTRRRGRRRPGRPTCRSRNRCPR